MSYLIQVYPYHSKFNKRELTADFAKKYKNDDWYEIGEYKAIKVDNTPSLCEKWINNTQIVYGSKYEQLFPKHASGTFLLTKRSDNDKCKPFPEPKPINTQEIEYYIKKHTRGCDPKKVLYTIKSGKPSYDSNLCGYYIDSGRKVTLDDDLISLKYDMLKNVSVVYVAKHGKLYTFKCTNMGKYYLLSETLNLEYSEEEVFYHIYPNKITMEIYNYSEFCHMDPWEISCITILNTF